MTDFRLDIVGDGTSVTLCPVGTIDRDSARVLVDALEAARSDAGAFLAVQLDGVERFTEEGLAVLAHADLPIEPNALTGT